MQSQQSERTLQHYDRVFRSLCRQAGQEADQNGEVPDPFGLVTYLEDRWGDWAFGTQTAYKAATLYFFEKSSNVPAGIVQRVRGFAIARERGSTAKARRDGFQPEPRQLLIDRILNGRSPINGLAAEWIKAGILTGLRPSEWADAEFLESYDNPGGIPMCPALKVNTIKRQGGDDRLPVRYLGLNNLTDGDIGSISGLVTFLRVHFSGADIGKLVKQVSQLIARQVAHIPELAGATLYNTRHQFAANAKSVYSIPAVGALMGHVSMVTSPSRYASAAISEMLDTGRSRDDGVWRVSAVPFADAVSLQFMDAIHEEVSTKLQARIIARQQETATL